MSYTPHRFSATHPGPGTSVMEITDVSEVRQPPPGAVAAHAPADREEWQACYSIIKALELGDDETLEGLRNRPEFQGKMHRVLESDACRLVNRLHPRVMQQLHQWLGGEWGQPPNRSDLPALSKLVALLSVQQGPDSLRPKTREERRADAVLSSWASSSSAEGANFRLQLSWSLLWMHHDGSRDLQARMPRDSRFRERLEQVGLLNDIVQLMDGPSPETSIRTSHALTQRLVNVLDALIANDPRAMDCVVHVPITAEGPSTSAGLAHFSNVEAVLDYLSKVPAPRLRPREGWEAFGVALESAAACPTTAGVPSGAEWNQVWRALTRRSQPPVARSTSVLSLPGPASHDSSRHPGSATSSPQSTDWALLLARQDSTASGGTGSVFSRLTSFDSDVSSPATSFPGSAESWARSSLPPPQSLEWLPPLGAEPTRSPERTTDELPASGPRNLDKQEAAALMRLLAGARQLPLMPTTTYWLDTADRLVRARMAVSNNGIALGAEESAMLQSTVLRLLRVAFDRVSTSDQKDIRPRGTREMAALRELAAWAAKAQGVDGARRSRWIEVILDRAMNPAGTPTISAKLLLTGAPLPPWPAVRALVNGDRVRDFATLAWRGEGLQEGGTVTRLLEGLGIRHIDLTMSAIGGHALPPALNMDCLSAATLRLEGKLDPVPLGHALRSMEERMRSLCMVRLVDKKGAAVNADPETLPGSWDADPGVAGRVVQYSRDTRWEVMNNLRTLWPNRRMPPALRASALNTRGGGVEVLSYLSQLRALRREHGQFARDDIEMLVLLETVIEGMAADADYTGRCEHMVNHPEGDCSDAGMGVLAAMAEMRDVAAAETPLQVAENAFTQACLRRADAARAERRLDFRETLEDAMVLRWFVSSALNEWLGDRVRVSPKPMFGRVGEGADWDGPERSQSFHDEATALIRAEVEDGFPGVVVLVASEGPIGAAFQRQLDVGQVFQDLDKREAVAREAYGEAFDRDGDTTLAMAELTAVNEARGAARLAAMRPRLDQIRALVLGTPAQTEGTEVAEGDEPLAKRARP